MISGGLDFGGNIGLVSDASSTPNLKSSVVSLYPACTFLPKAPDLGLSKCSQHGPTRDVTLSVLTLLATPVPTLLQHLSGVRAFQQRLVPRGLFLVTSKPWLHHSG